MNLKTFASLAVALGASLGAGLAHAGPDVQWSLSIGAPMLLIHGQSAPLPGRVQVLPAPVYVQPAPFYAPRRAARWDRDGDGIPNRYDRWDNRRDGWHESWRRDRDHDGVPNRHDRFPENPWRR